MSRGNKMTTLIIIAGIVFSLIILSRVRRSFRKYKVALNCLMAKATFAQANDDLQSASVFRSWQVLQNMCGPEGLFLLPRSCAVC